MDVLIDYCLNHSFGFFTPIINADIYVSIERFKVFLSKGLRQGLPCVISFFPLDFRFIGPFTSDFSDFPYLIS